MKTPARIAHDVLEKVGMGDPTTATQPQDTTPNALAKGLRIGASNMVSSQTVAGQGLPGGMNLNGGQRTQ